MQYRTQIDSHSRKSEYTVEEIFLISRKKLYIVAIRTLPHIKRIGIVSVRSSHLPFKLHNVGLRAFKSPYISDGLWIATAKTRFFLRNLHFFFEKSCRFVLINKFTNNERTFMCKSCKIFENYWKLQNPFTKKMCQSPLDTRLVFGLRYDPLTLIW